MNTLLFSAVCFIISHIMIHDHEFLFSSFCFSRLFGKQIVSAHQIVFVCYFLILLEQICLVSRSFVSADEIVFKQIVVWKTCTCMLFTRLVSADCLHLTLSDVEHANFEMKFVHIRIWRKRAFLKSLFYV